MVCWKGIVSAAVVLLNVMPFCQTAKILGFLVTPSQSQFNIHDALMRGLAAKGHEVCCMSIRLNNFLRIKQIYIRLLSSASFHRQLEGCPVQITAMCTLN